MEEKEDLKARVKQDELKLTDLQGKNNVSYTLHLHGHIHPLFPTFPMFPLFPTVVYIILYYYVLYRVSETTVGRPEMILLRCKRNVRLN